MRERTWFSTVDVMNLNDDRREGVNVVDSRLFPVLLLLKVWSEGSDPCSNIDLVLLLLESICALEGVEEVSQRLTGYSVEVLSHPNVLTSMILIVCMCIEGNDTANCVGQTARHG